MTPTMLVLLALATLTFVGSAAVLLVKSDQDRRVARRLRVVRDGPQQAVPVREGPIAGGVAARTMIAFGDMVASRFIPAKTLAEFSVTLSSAGFRGNNALAIFIGSKIVLTIGAPVLAFMLAGYMEWSGGMRLIATFGALVIGMLAPDYAVRSLRARHLKRVEAGLADALDMMVICAEAGLALEPAVTRVGREIAAAHPSVSREFLQTANEMRIGSDFRVAMGAFARRVPLDGVKRLTTTLLQTLQYGTPLGDALRVLSAEMRQEMLTRFEARAARLPVLLTLPMIVFILPCVFLIVAGPAVIQVIRNFRG